MTTAKSALAVPVAPTTESKYSLSTPAIRDSFCFECGTKILRGQDSYAYTGDATADEPWSIILCLQCDCDWRILTRIEGQHARPCLVQFGTLRDRVVTAQTCEILICAEGASLRTRWVPTSQETKQPITEVIESALPKDYTKATLEQLLAEFESDMTYDSKTGYDRQRFRRSLARQELCRRRGALQGITRHLKRQLPGSAPFVRTGWGNLLCYLQMRIDPDNTGTPDDFNAINGWIEWAERFMASQK